MAIRLLKSREKDATPALLIKDAIEIGVQYKEIASKSRFYRRLRTNGKVAETIRDCNNTLGMSGNFKNGCLYREQGLSEYWKKGNGEVVVCDHAIPVTELVRLHQEDGEPIEKLIFSPVVRITRKSNDDLTFKGYAKSGHKQGFPLFRYSLIGMRVVTHLGREIDPAVWTDEDHWQLVLETDELRPILDALGISK